MLTNNRSLFSRLLVSCTFLFFSAVFNASAQNLEIHMINIDQGQSILIKGPDGTTILFDGGKSSPATTQLIPYLQGQGILNSLSYMVVSHLDTDHFGGLVPLIENGYDVQLAIYDNGSSKSNASIDAFKAAAATTTAGAVQPITLGQVIQLGNGATATAVATNGSVDGVGVISGALANENDLSTVLLVQYGNFDFIAGGDLGGGPDDGACTGRSTGQFNVETQLVQALLPGGANPLLSEFGVEVMMPNHHGSESSTNSDYMNGLSPQVAPIQTGELQGSNFHHPRIDVVEKVLGATVPCVTVQPALVLQTEEGSPTGANTSFAGFAVGDIVFSTDGVSSYTVDATGNISQGPDERVAAGLPRVFPFEEGASGPVTPKIIFSEVAYDPAGAEPGSEWIELYNAGSTSVDLSGFMITDNNGMGTSLTIPVGNSIAPNTYFTIARDGAVFSLTFGKSADFNGIFPGLNNGGDALLLKDSTGNELDAVGWEAGGTGGLPTAWGSTSEPNAPDGSTIQRFDVSVDTDLFSDWIVAAFGDPQTQLDGPPNVAPIANANGPYSSQSNTINFSSAGSADTDGFIVSYAWDFGDGNVSSVENPIHTYTSLGNYNVSLTVTDNNSASSIANTTASVIEAPTVYISEVYYDTIGTDSAEEWIELFNAGVDAVDLSNWTITDNNGIGSVLTLDAGSNIAAGTHFTVATNQAGFLALYGRDADLYKNIFSLNNTGDALILKDNNGNQLDAVAWEGGAIGGVPTSWCVTGDPSASTGSSIQRTIPSVDTDSCADWSTLNGNGNPETQTSTPPPNTPPTAMVNGPYTGIEGQPIAFSSTGSSDSDGTIANFNWDFGDGATSSLANPSHAYLSAGSFTATLTVTDDGGATDNGQTLVSVEAAASDKIVFSEVYYDPAGTESKEEWIELYNAGVSAVDMSGWIVIDNNGTGSSYVIPAGVTINAGEYLVIAKQSKGFNKLYGFNPDVTGNIPSLNNTGDALILQDSAGIEIDAVAWEGGASSGVPSTWGSASAPNAAEGNTIMRTNVNSDTDTFTDWSVTGNTGTPSS